MKICTICEKAKPLTEFWKRKKAPDGLQYDCKDCCKERKRQHYVNNTEKEIRRSVRWGKLNAAKVAANVKRLREANPEHYRAYKKEYLKNNYEKIAIRELNRTALRRMKSGVEFCPITAEEWKNIKINQDHKCFYCGSNEKLTQDHKVPLCRDGKHILSNIVAACLSCNSRKGRKTSGEFILARSVKKEAGAA